MKNFTHILFALVFSASCFAQNPLFRSFGESYKQVLTHLQTLGYVRVEQGEDFLSAETDGFRMFYFFNHKALYKMVLSSTYDRRKDADAALALFKHHYQHSQSFIEVNEMRNDKTVTSFTARRSGEQVLVQHLETAEDSHEIQLMAESESYSPSFVNLITMK